MKTNKKVAIVDYGVGNLWSVLKAVRQFAPNTEVTEEKKEIEEAKAIILPGVGTFKAGMDGLAVRDLVQTIKTAAGRGVPILGICLGAQLLMERGYEFGERAGLGLVKGEVVKFPELPAGIKIPDIGWQEVRPAGNKSTKALFLGVERPYFYFVHSYILKPKDIETSLAETTYGGYNYCAAIGEGKTYGTQFHPEKSGKAGLKLIENFLAGI
ncbi:MAG: imidazole glycerol phosphate synthase subunit HisH [bacterium]|nr:imidazole glycerol phosphate synthase subunit HisH [bacterium]